MKGEHLMASLGLQRMRIESQKQTAMSNSNVEAAAVEFYQKVKTVMNFSLSRGLYVPFC